MKYSVKYRLTSLDIAPSGAVRPGALLRYFQEAVNLQMRDNPPSSEDLFENGQAFILISTGMKIYTDLSLYDEIEVVTWANTSQGVKFVRSAQIFRDGVLAVDIVTVWALRDIKENKFIRVKDAVLGIGTLDELPEIGVPEKLKLTECEMEKLGEKTVFYSDIDRNDHMNNTRYIDMICDFLPDVQNKKTVSFTVNYVTESKLGEKLDIYHKNIDGLDYFCAIKEDGKHSLDVVMTLEKIK